MCQALEREDEDRAPFLIGTSHNGPMIATNIVTDEHLPHCCAPPYQVPSMGLRLAIPNLAAEGTPWIFRVGFPNMSSALESLGFTDSRDFDSVVQ